MYVVNKGSNPLYHSPDQQEVTSAWQNRLKNKTRCIISILWVLQFGKGPVSRNEPLDATGHKEGMS